MNESQRKNELTRLEQVLQQIAQQLNSVTESSIDSQQELRKSLGDFWENAGRNAIDAAQFVETIDRQRSLTAMTEKRRHQLEKMAHSPYFGRLDFTENGTTEEDIIYIGISTLTEQDTGRLLVYDWRTPVAGMFYDFERGNAWYECPAGRIEGKITLKRQYKIIDGKMIYMFDSDIKIDDEILQQILTKSVDAEMHTIITSIQRDQNRIIRNEGYDAVFVEGPAGSGKTSIALHRVAYLLYRDRDSISSRNVLILSPNHVFSEYIASVLPEIGEENVPRMTFLDCLSPLHANLALEIENRAEQLEQLLSPSGRPSAARADGIAYKSSNDFTALLDRYIGYLDQHLVSEYPAIEYDDQVLFSREDWHSYYYDTFAFLPILRRLAKIRETIQRKMRPLVHEIRRKKTREITAAAEEINEKTIAALARIAAKRELDPLYSKVERLTSLDAVTAYRRLFSDTLFLQLSKGLARPPEWRQIKNYTLASLGSGKLPYEDTFPFLYLKGKLEGFTVNRQIKHLVIDEAQDYTALQYKIMTILFPICTWTVLGDPEQQVHPYIRTADFKLAGDIIQKDNPFFFRLTRSYRSTRQIQKFCQALLPESKKSEFVHRDGPLPLALQCESYLDQLLIRTIDDLRQEGYQSIAVICKTASECITIYEALSGIQDIFLLTSEEHEFHVGVVIIPIYLAKGLEFDAVLIVGADNHRYGQETDRHILYTACTRALHRLILLYQGTFSPLISGIDSGLFRKQPHPS